MGNDMYQYGTLKE